MNLWLYLHFPRLQLDTLFAEGEQVPICIIEKHKVVQANQDALKTGIQLGTGLASAASLCSDLQVTAYEPEFEQQRLQQVAQWLYLYTSDITLFPNKGLLLKVTGMLTLYRDLESYWKVISGHLDKLNLSYQYATAYSPLAAKLLAEVGTNCIYDKKEQIDQQLFSQSIHASELSGSNIEKLNRIGVRNLEQLLTLNMTEIARRFDIQVVNYVGRLLGQFKHPVQFYHPPAYFSQDLVLLYEVEHTDWLQKPLTRLLEQLEQFLKLRDQVAYEIKLTLTQRDKAMQQVNFYSAIGDYLASKWQQLAKLTLESVTLSAPIISLELSVERMGETPASHKDLFDKHQQAMSPLELISQLQAKLGKQALHGIHPSPDPRPENSTQYIEPLQSPSYSVSSKKLLRPSFIYRKPKPLTHRVNILHGPERIHTGWWDGNSVKRDYFIARDEQGRWIWVYRTPKKEWFVQGLFS